jgi:hypothetical protein
VCDSKLPPRTEAWWDEATRQATCLTCELVLRAERGEMAPAPETPAPTEPPVPSAPTDPAPTDPAEAVPAAPTPQLPRLVEVTRGRRGALPERPHRVVPEPPLPALPPRDLPPPSQLPPRDAGPVPLEPAAPRLTETPKPAAARVPEPADPPDPPDPPDRSATPPAPILDPVDGAGAVDVAGGPAEPGGQPVQSGSDDHLQAEQASLHHDLDPSVSVQVIDVADGGHGGDLFAPAPIAVPVPNGERPVDLLAPPRPAPGASAHLVPADLLDRGDLGDGRVGQTLEGGRVHGFEVVHGLRVEAGMRAIDHLVVAVNGLWVVDAVDVLAGKLERRDEGDWFTADPRLHIGGTDHTELVASVREKVEAITRLLVRTDFTDIPVRGVLCFGSVQPGWITEPFVLDGVAITWRRKLVEPMLEPVLIDQNSRSALLNLLVAARVDPRPRPTAPLPVDEEREVS